MNDRPLMRDRHAELGLPPVVNAAATLTKLGGSLMSPSTIEAMVQGAERFVDMTLLRERVCARIAELTQNEAAFVTSGAAAGVTMSVVACMTRDDPTLTMRFPEMDAFPRSELVMYGSQRNGYDYAAAMTGVRIVEADVERHDLASCLNERTAAVLWFAGTRLRGNTPEVTEIVRIAHALGVPVIVDAAAQIPPASALWTYTNDLDVDLVIFSGGKGLCGPQATGLVLGRQELIRHFAANASPNYSFGRGMKVGKEEYFGILAAVEEAVCIDEAAVLAEYERIVDAWLEALPGLPGVEVARGYPSEAGQPHSRTIVRVLPDAGFTADDLADAMMSHDPAVAVLVEREVEVALNPQCVLADEVTIVSDVARTCILQLAREGVTANQGESR